MGRRGPLSQISTLAGILVRSEPRFDRPDLQMNIFLWSIEKRDSSGIYAHKWPGFSISPVHLRPEGRGRVSLKSPDPLAPPRIEFKYLETAYDVDAMLYGLRFARKVAAQPALAPYVGEEVQPGPAVASDEALMADLRNRGVSNLHPVGTCRMGNGADAVVDPRLRVHGIRGPAGDGRLDHAAGGRRQHQRPLHHDRRKGRRHDPPGRQGRLTRFGCGVCRCS